MTPDDFVNGLKTQCADAAVHDCVELLNAPPGRRPNNLWLACPSGIAVSLLPTKPTLSPHCKWRPMQRCSASCVLSTVFALSRINQPSPSSDSQPHATVQRHS